MAVFAILRGKLASRAGGVDFASHHCCLAPSGSSLELWVGLLVSAQVGIF
jgi:hypothetical protein